MKILDGYIETEVGTIPVDWGTCLLEEISEFITKGATPTTYGFNWEESGILFLKSDCITPNGFSYGDSKYISTEAHKQMSRSIVKPGDILMSITGYIGKVITLPDVFIEANINQHIARIRINSKLHDPRFVFFSLLIPQQINLLVKNSTGQAYPQLSLEQVRNIRMYYPPLPEQQKIADILTTVDDQISETESLIEKTKVLKQGLMQQLLTKGIGHNEFKDTEIGRIPVGWEVVELSRAARIVMGQSPSSETYNSEGEGLPFYQGKADFSDKFPETRFWCSSPIKVVPSNCILISVRAPVGAVNLCKTESCIGRGLAAIVNSDPDKVMYLYFYMQLFSSKLEKVSQGSTFTAINSGDLTNFDIALPPLHEQRQIATILTTIDDQVDTYQSKLASLSRLKTGLMQQLLTGKIRVKV